MTWEVIDKQITQKTKTGSLDFFSAQMQIFPFSGIWRNALNIKLPADRSVQMLIFYTECFIIQLGTPSDIQVIAYFYI